MPDPTLAPSAISRPNLSDSEIRAQLAQRNAPYFNIIAYSRHVGFHKRPDGNFWVARYRTKKGGYKQHRLGRDSEDMSGSASETRLTHAQAMEGAKHWFQFGEVTKEAVSAQPIGACQHLKFCPVGDVFTIGHAINDYVEWKRLAASQSHFETMLSRINWHIVPRLASLPVADFNSDVLMKFIRDVLETPPKRGKQDPGPRRRLEDLSSEELRRRKKTVNSLIGTLKMALQLGWENRKFDDERFWRFLKLLPAVDRPRVLHLSRDECRALLSKCRSDVRRLVLGALYTGCRATEIVRMRCSHVGRDGYGVYITPVKNYRERFVFLPDEAMFWFLSLINGRSPDDYVFIRDDGQPWFNRSYRYSFRAAMAEANIPMEFTFHGLRHTYASQLIQSGTTVFAVAEQLGHADPVTVLKTYGHLTPQIREAEVRQRFTTLDPVNASLAKEQNDALEEWRGRLHGEKWNTYAQITKLAPDAVESQFMQIS